MKKKINISLFLRKPRKNFDYSTEIFYKELFYHTNKNKNLNIIKKEVPFTSKGFVRRIYLTIWCFFNQNEINHVAGDINFANIFLIKRKSILTILDIYSLKRLKGLKKILYKFFWLDLPIHKSAKIITISENVKKELCKIFKINKDKIKVIPCSVSKIFKPKYKRINFKNLNILFIGTAKNKNLYRVLSALKGLKVKIIIIGELSNEYRKLIFKNKIIYQNFINQTQRQIYNHYVKCDILLYPSIYEGFGIPIIEAQSVGRLVITSSNLKNTAGNGAIYVNPLSVNDIRKKVSNLIKNNYKTRKLINLGFKNLEKYNLKDIKNNYLNFYNSFYENIGRN